MKLFLALIILFSWANLALSAEKIYFRIPYIVDPATPTLNSIYLLFARPDRTITPEDAAYQRTQQQNPQIRDWNQLKPGQELGFYIKIKDLDLAKYRAYYFGVPVKVNKDPEGIKANIFYMASYGRFIQSDPQRGDVTFYQNSPFSLGTSVSYFPKESPWSLASSLYYSYLESPENNLNKKKTTMPPEIGAALYGEYESKQYGITGYLGPDYERFSTFTIIDGGETEVHVDRNTVIFLTAGISRSIEIFKRPLFTKISFSESVYSSSDSSSGDGFKGHRFLWYLNKKISPSLFVHGLFKYHLMEGPVELSTMRVGVGFGYIFL